MDPVDVRHLVRPQRCGDDVQQHARPRMEQGQDLGDGETAARCLAARLAEVTLQFGCVGHGEGRPVDEKRPMPMPAACVFGRGNECTDHEAEHGAEDGQGQPGGAWQ